MFYLDLIQNVALLMFLVVIHGQIMRRWNKRSFGFQAFSGFLFGCVALTGMMTPVHLMPGLIFDGRSIVLSVAGLFGGPVTAGTAAIMSASYRMWLGGSGTLMGVSVILESAGLGVAFYYLRHIYPGLIRNLYLFGFGLLVHAGMLLLMLTLPKEAVIKTMEHIAIPVMLIFPATTWLFCVLFLDQESRISAEETLRDREQRYRAVFDNAAVGIDTLDRDGRIVQVNPALCNMLGYTEDELKQLTFTEITHPDDREISTKYLESLMSGKKDSYKLEKRYLRKDGKILWGDLSTSSVKNANGHHLGTVGVIADITERKRVEEALRERERVLDTLINNLPGFVYRCANDRDWTMEYISNGCLGVTGYAPDDFINNKNLTYNDIVHPDYREPLWQKWQELLINKEVFEEEYPIIVKNGALRWVWERGQGVFSEDGRLLFLEGFITDITKLKISEKALKISEAKYRQLADVAFEGIIFHDEGVLLQANNQFFEMFGYQPDELIGTHITEKTLTPESAKTVRAQIAARSTESYLATGLKKDGTTFPLEIRARTWEIEGKEIRATAISDISRLKDLEAQLLQAQKMEAIGHLAGGIAHDFNNLLQTVMGYSELLMVERKSRKQEVENLQKIYDAGKRGSDLVKNLLMFSRKVQPEFRQIDLNQEIVLVLKLLSHTIPKTIKTVLRLSGELATIPADPSQIGQVLMNLCVNARDAMPNGGVISIETSDVELDEEYCRDHHEIKPGRYVLLTVSDTGQGMDSETQSHLFEPFFTTKEVGKGTGLGLATVYGIVKQHKGHITCYSEPEHGTTFRIYFPVIPYLQDFVVPDSEMNIPGGVETILMVDDEDTVRELCREILGNFGYKAITAQNGKEALEIYQRQSAKISLVILDLIMPEMDGGQCMKEILRIDPHAKILIASGHLGNEPDTRKLFTGAKDFLNKPYDMSQLLHCVRRILDND